MPTAKRIQYRYTPTGQRSSLIDPDGGRFTYSYDSVKRLTQVINPQGERTSYSYDAAGRRTVKKLANGSRTSFSYNAASRITSVAHLKSDASVQARFSYQYDKAGNRTSLSELDGSITTWSYDNLDQLTAEHRTGTNPYRNTYVYDNRGNRTLKNLDGQRTTSSYDDANQLKWSQDASGRTTYTFDADGNQQVVLSPSGDRVTNLWDYENRLIGVLHPDGSRETMAYDPDGKRVKLQETASTTKYVWDDQNYLQETNASDVTQVTYTNEPRVYGNLISQRTSSASHYYLFDALGSTRLVTDASENISESLLYDAWGNLITAAPTMAVPFRWVGELGYLFVPANSDYYVRARVYQPGIGRWISRDPLGPRIDLNDFRYVRNHLFRSIDPAGTEPWQIEAEVMHTAVPYLECGLSATVLWKYSMADNGEVKAVGRPIWIVQRVIWLCGVFDCPWYQTEHDDLHEIQFFEAWPLEAHETYAHGGTFSDLNIEYTDSGNIFAVPGRFGYQIATRTARAYYRDDVPEIQDWKTRMEYHHDGNAYEQGTAPEDICTISAGDFKSSKTFAKWKDDEGFSEELLSSISLAFRCCECEEPVIRPRYYPR